MATDKIIARPALKWFKGQNFKAITCLEVKDLPENAPWIFLTGENGYGKTCVLQALASSLSGFEKHMLDVIRTPNDLALFSLLHKDNLKYGFKVSDVTVFRDKKVRNVYEISS